MAKTAKTKAAEVVVNCEDLAEMVEFLVERLDFRLEMIVPADAPTKAVVSGFGVVLRLERAAVENTVTLRLEGQIPNLEDLPVPKGLKLIFAETSNEPCVPEGTNEFIITKPNEQSSWHEGRAGMLYRDLMPGRLGGSFIASHIRIPVGGPVPDYVHFHKVRFQMIYCLSGWSKLVYEDQGQPFIMNAGDCVLQPPEIRHRVLECSDGFDVLEIGCPAVHETFADYSMLLPNSSFAPGRVYGGQRFVHAKATENTSSPTELNGVMKRGTSISEATNGLADVETLFVNKSSSVTVKHADEFYFIFVVKGELVLTESDGTQHEVSEGGAIVLARGATYGLEFSAGLEAVRVRLPQFSE